MQVEHKTEKGTIQFRLIPNDGNPFTTGITASNPIAEGFEYIGLTSEVTEDQAKVMLPKPLERKTDFGIQYGYMFSPMETEICISALDAWRALMQFKKLYEVNPYSNKCDCEIGLSQIAYDACLEEIRNHNLFKDKCGKWIVLFKEN